MRFARWIVPLSLAAAVCPPARAAGEAILCRVPLFRGASQPQGGDAEMHVVNTGRPCGIRNFGAFPDTGSLAFDGAITTPPKHGVAAFVAPRAVYTPAAGFAGEDYFEYRANAKGPQDNPVLLKVRVKVVVTAE